jgi:hypothetical protein
VDDEHAHRTLAAKHDRARLGETITLGCGLVSPSRRNDGSGRQLPRLSAHRASQE